MDYTTLEFTLSSRQNAEIVIGALAKLIIQNEYVTVADLYNLVSLDGWSTYKDHRYGWTNLNGVTIIKIGRRYSIELPRPELIK